VPFAGLLYAAAVIFYVMWVFSSAPGGPPPFVVILIPFAIAFLGSAVGVWRQSRVGYMAAVASSALMLVLFGSEFPGALAEPHNLGRFVTGITALPVVAMVLIYSVPQLRRQVAPATPPRTIPRSGVLALVVVGFIVGGLVAGLVAGGVVARVLASSGVPGDIYMVAGASSPSNPEFFSPATIEVKVGQAITWVNRDSTAHTITSDAGDFNSGEVLSGALWTHAFSAPGTYTYHCDPHPWMKGTIVVSGS
jgi:plastocyanin